MTACPACGQENPEGARFCLACGTAVGAERHGGTVEKFIGDAVMAVFGIPVLHEDDALRAVRAADDLRHAVARLSEDLPAGHGGGAAVRVGVATGEVVAEGAAGGGAF